MNLVTTGRSLNILHLSRQLLAFNIVLLALIFFGYISTAKFYFGEKYTASMSIDILEIVTKNSYHLYLLLIYPLLVTVFLIYTFLITNKPNPLPINEEKSDFFDKIIKDIKSNSDLSFLNFHPHLNNTFVANDNIYLSLKDINNYKSKKNQTLFKIYHELYHYLIYDTSIGRIEKSVTKSTSVFYSAIAGLLVGGAIQDYIYSIRPCNIPILDFTIIITSCYFFYLFFLYLFNTVSRSKEFLCDKYSKEKLGDIAPKLDFGNAGKITHPSFVKRISYLKGDSSPLLDAYLSNSAIYYCILYPIVSGMPHVTTLIFILLMIDITILAITLTKIESAIFFKISKVKVFFTIAISFSALYLNVKPYLLLSYFVSDQLNCPPFNPSFFVKIYLLIPPLAIGAKYFERKV